MAFITLKNPGLKRAVRTIPLIFVALLVPLIWGWGTYRLLRWLWPAKPAGSHKQEGEVHSSANTIDYQI